MILGGGAAGLLCAIEAGKRGRHVAVLERSERIGKKILISGGGRCNFTNIHCQPANFLSANPHFAKSALARFTPADFIALVEKHGIPYHEKTLGQLFCDRSARDITEMLEAECRLAGVEIVLNCRIGEVGRDIGRTTERSTEFVVRTENAAFRAPELVVATGGLSVPKIGATALGYHLARQFGLKIQQAKPALVALLLAPPDRSRYCDLAGVSTEVIAMCGGHSFREKMLITHRGLSGPAILQASSYWEPQMPICIDLAPGLDVTSGLRTSKSRNVAAARTVLQEALPNRLAARWLELHAPSQWTNAEIAKLERQVHAWMLTPKDTEGYQKAEVTAGGVDTGELSAATMECKKVPGLYFIGEVVDVTGELGGFNFQWAWASGAAAGRAL